MGEEPRDSSGGGGGLFVEGVAQVGTCVKCMMYFELVIVCRGK